MQVTRRLIALFIVLLILSGLTAFPTVSELHLLLRFGTFLPDAVYQWLMKVSISLDEVDRTKPYLLYGYDWLAFAHIIISLFLIGAWRDPIANRWVIRTAMLACVGIFPLAFICAPIRGIPIGWTFIDCSFGIFGMLLLWIIDRRIELSIEHRTLNNEH